MKLRVIGMISGTSFDAIDAAVADLSLDGDRLTMTPLGLTSAEMPAEIRERIAAVLPPANAGIEAVARLDADLGRLFGSVAGRANDEIAGGAADLVVSHGQTVFHWVDDGRARGTLQLGNPAWIAAATGLSVVSDLRNRDIAAGGHGAPLVSILDALLILAEAPDRGSLNLGGIANITVHDGAGVLAYDLGPANALIDAAVVEISCGAEHFDADGRRAAGGTVRADLLERLLAEPYYGAPAPKSTGKELFHRGYLDQMRAGLPAIGDDDLVATLTELTARVVAMACGEHGLTDLVVGGGGVRNPVLMNRIRELVSPCAVRPVDDFGLPAQAKEAYTFALLGYLTVHGLPGTLPGATGAPVGSVLGSVTPGPGGWRLPPAGSMAPGRLVIGGARPDAGGPPDQPA
jgi:anhydro-N-acetylmuramic acid kinase